MNNRSYYILLSLLFFSVVLGYNNGQPRSPPLGWNTWCTQGNCGLDICNEDEIKRIAQAMLDNGMYSAGYRFINLGNSFYILSRTRLKLISRDQTTAGRQLIALTTH